MYMYMYIHMYIYMQSSQEIWLQAILMGAQVCAGPFKQAHIHSVVLSPHICIWICIFIYIYIYVHIHIYIYMYIYI